jgi:aryl-alcohol dehydrogenase-like predicted oxidoreductase
MNYRQLGKTNFNISEISLGTWQVGGKWGSTFDVRNAETILRNSIEQGVNFIDTADVYSDGLSEEVTGRIAKEYKNKVLVATKCGRRFQPHIDESYALVALRKSVEDSLSNMKLDCIDLIQLHCPPWETYYRPEVFGLFERLREEGKIQHLGVSIEKVEQGIKAMQYSNVTTIQVIYNMFRQRPSEMMFDLARKNNVGIIVRVPLASGLLSGKYDLTTKFESGDHRTFNREGAAFDKGETFSGVKYELGLNAVQELKAYFGSKDLAQVAIQWTLQEEAVSCVIPGASRPDQADHNLQSEKVGQLTEADMDFVKEIYEKYIKEEVHERW